MNAKCAIHSKDIVQFFDDSDSKTQQKGFCLNCIIGTSNYESSDEKVIENKQRVLNWIKQLNRNSVQVLKQISEDFEKFQQQILSILKKITQEINRSILLLNNFEKSLDVDSNLDEYYQKFDSLNKGINHAINFEFDEFKILAIIDNLQAQLKLQFIKPPVLLDQDQQEILNRMNENQFQYKLLEQNNKKQNDYCFAIAFNENASLIFFGCGKLIRISKFQQGKILPDEQQIFEHKDYIYSLHFMKKTKTLISSSYDKKIILYDKHDSWYWKTRQVLDDNNSSADCLISNVQENLIIYGTKDKYIKFWEKINKYWVCQFTLQTDFKVESLSFDDGYNKLIACGDYSDILVIQQLSNNEWAIIQKIAHNAYGERVCFIDSNQFLFAAHQIEVYELNQYSNQYNRTQILKIENENEYGRFFPFQFLKQKNIVFVKRSRYLNILKRQSNGEFLIQQSINFQTSEVFGRVTDDGQYLVTWDKVSKQFQIWQFDCDS